MGAGRFTANDINRENPKEKEKKDEYTTSQLYKSQQTRQRMRDGQGGLVTAAAL